MTTWTVKYGPSYYGNKIIKSCVTLIKESSKAHSLSIEEPKIEPDQELEIAGEVCINMSW